MADSNDDLLEDGDLSETNFEELDLAEEDALLADDDEKPLRGVGTSEDNLGTGEEDDYIIIEDDEDLSLNDEEGNEIKDPSQEANNNENDDSDDDKGGERSRFKSERLIITSSSSRDPKAIPETLDAVALRNPVKISNFRGGNRGGIRPGQRGGQIRKFFPRNPNIHVNPHFKPRIPMGGPHMWNGVFQGPPHPQFQPPHPPFGGFIPPAMQPPGWNGPGYYNTPVPHFNPPPMDNTYYGQNAYYQSQQNFQSPALVQPQMGWGDNFYSGPQPQPPTNFQPASYFAAGPDPQIGPTRMRPPFPPGPPRPPFGMIQNRPPFMGKPMPGPIHPGNIRPLKREFHNQNKVPPMKQQKFDNTAVRVRSNLEEVKIVDSVPPLQPAPAVEEEDDEMKAYRKKIEEQKKLREKILQEKEKKRLVAAQQKAQETGTTGQVTTPTKPPPVDDGPPGVNSKVQLNNIAQYKVVRIRKGDGNIIHKKVSLSLVEISTVNKVPPPATKPAFVPPVETPSRVVAVENLSASTTQKQIVSLAGKIGPLEKVELDRSKKTAIIRFIRIESAKDFVTKYHRKMVDLSMIGVKFVKED